MARFLRCEPGERAGGRPPSPAAVRSEVEAMKNQRNVALTTLAFAMTMLLVMAWSPASRADTALHKAGRGLAAMTTPFLQIPGNIIQTSQREGDVAGWTTWVTKG